MRRLIALLTMALVALTVAACTPPPTAAPPPPDYRPVDQLNDTELDQRLAQLAPTMAQNLADPAVLANIPVENRAEITARVAALNTAAGRAAFIPALRSATLAPRVVDGLSEVVNPGALGTGAGKSRSILFAAPPKGAKDGVPAAAPAGTTNVAQGPPGAGACNAPNGVGPVTAPADVAPAQILTPQHDVYTTTSSGIAINQAGPLSVAGLEPIAGQGPGIQLRNRNFNTQEMLVRINLDDPKNYGPRALYPLLSIRKIGGTKADEYYANSSIRNAGIYCYANDTARPDRGYWEGWILIPRAEPGFQLIAEVVENDWFFQQVQYDFTLSPAGPQYFAGADRSTVHAGAAPVSSAQSLPKSAGVFATSGPQGTANPNVLTETNGIATDDLESALTTLVGSKIRSTAAGLAGSFAKGNYAAGIYITDVTGVDPSVDIDYVQQSPYVVLPDEPVGSTGALRGFVSDTGIRAGVNLWFLGVPCVGASATVDVTARADIWADPVGTGTGIDARINASASTPSASFSMAHWYNWLDPVCWGGYLLGPTAIYLTVGNAIESGIKDAFDVDSDGNAGAVQRLVDGFDLNSVLPTVGVGTSNIRPIVTNIDNGWCGSYTTPTGCTPNQDLFGQNGLEVVGDAAMVGSLGDALGGTFGGRFRNVFRPSLSTKIQDLVTAHRDINQRMAGVGAIVDPAMINVVLRHLTQGSSTNRTTNGLLNITNASIPAAGVSVSTRPEVAPAILGVPVDTTPVLCDGACGPPPFPTPPSRLAAATVLPDLRVDISNGGAAPIQLSIAASTNVGLAFDPQILGIGPTLASTLIDVQVVGGCQANYGSAYALSYNLCGRGFGGAGGTYTLAGLLDWIANDALLPMLTNSIGKIKLPSLSGLIPGFDVAITNLRFSQRGGYLTVLGDLGRVPRLSVAISDGQLPQSLQFAPTGAVDINFQVPGTTYEWTITDGVTNQPVASTVVPGTGNSFVTVPLSAFTEAPGPQKKVNATLKLSQPGFGIVATGSYTWNPPVPPGNPNCGIPGAVFKQVSPTPPTGTC